MEGVLNLFLLADSVLQIPTHGGGGGIGKKGGHRDKEKPMLTSELRHPLPIL